MSPRRAPQAGPLFQSLEHRPFTAVGPKTGRSYPFKGRGAVLTVDPRDAPHLARLPQLRRVARAPGS